MRAYNEQWIYNREIIGQAARWHRQRLVTDEQLAAVRKAYPVEFRQTNSFIEIGLFLFTTVAILACYLLPASIFSALLTDQTTYGLFNMAFGIGVGIVGNLLINRRLLYRNGIDNAFVVTLTGFLAFGLNQLFPNGLSVATHCLITLPLLLLVLWYYGDTLIAFFSLAAIYTYVFDSLLKTNGGKDVLPFVMMGISLTIFFVTKQLSSRNPKQLYYTDPLNLAQWISLIVLAASGNYFVMRELNGILLKSSILRNHAEVAPEIALAWLFWLLTFLIPVVYLWVGLTRRNRMLIILGALGLIGAFMTVHEYHALVPLNVALTIGGFALIGVAILGIRYLRTATADPTTGGFTDEPDDDSPSEFFTNTATAMAIQAVSATPHQPRDDARFGGGDFGGAGSESKY